MKTLWGAIVNLFKPLPMNGKVDWKEKVEVERRLVVLEHEVKALRRR